MIDLTDVVPFASLDAATKQITDVWGFGPVRVWPLPRHLESTHYGRCDPGRRVVWYAREAPLGTVAHELAHVLTRGDEHGEHWRAAAGSLARLLVIQRD